MYTHRKRVHNTTYKQVDGISFPYGVTCLPPKTALQKGHDREEEKYVGSHQRPTHVGCLTIRVHTGIQIKNKFLVSCSSSLRGRTKTSLLIIGHFPYQLPHQLIQEKIQTDRRRVPNGNVGFVRRGSCSNPYN